MHVWSFDDLGNEKNTFDVSEALYVTEPGSGKMVRLYVVEDQANWTIGGALTDVSGNGYEELTLSTNETEVVKLWDSPLIIGTYDIVEDINRNRVYDEGVDMVDSDILIGFDVIPEISSFTMLLLIALSAMATILWRKMHV